MAAFSSCFCHSLTLHKINNLSGFVTDSSFNQRSAMSLKRVNRNLFHQRVAVKSKLTCEWSFMRGSRIITRPYFKKLIHLHTSTGSSAVPVRASLLVSSQIVSKVITIGTAAVLPFYILMVLLPKSVLTKRTMGSSMPSVMLGVLYAYLLYLSWTPHSMSLIFATKHWLPELPGLAKMFSSELTLASAWIHLLAVDLFAARQVFHDGLENNVETRHSVCLCLLACPIGILTHAITKALAICFKNANHVA